MRLKPLLLYITGISLLAACGNPSRDIAVDGEINGMPVQKVVLEQLGANDIIAIVDSARSDEKGHFKLSAASPEPGLYRLHFNDNKFILLSADKGNLRVKADWNNIEGYSVLGSQASEHLRKFLLMFREKLRDINTMNVVMDTLRTRGNDSLLAQAMENYRQMNRDFTMAVENYADTAPYQPNAVFAARVLNPASEREFLASFTQSLSRRFPGTRMTRDFTDYQSRISLKNPHPERIRPQNAETGAVAPELDLPDAENQRITLSSLRGNYVLLDFWASWCGPCRDENPYVVAAYKKYKDKNFTVYAVSLDHNRERWLEAVKEDGLSWTHVSDLKGWGSEAAVIYSIRSIPSNVLIDPKGVIIARNLRGEQLGAMLEQVMAAAQPQ